jgi:hypothetical protein
MEQQIQIDITLRKMCTSCHTDIPFRYVDGPMTIGERTTIECRVDADEFLPCSLCGNPLRLCIQAQPYELVNHLDSPVARAVYDQGYR